MSGIRTSEVRHSIGRRGEGFVESRASSLHRRVRERKRRMAGACRVLVLAAACTSCAAVQRQYVPLPGAGEPELRWPPLPIDAYVTRDGTRHDLPRGFMVETGDSVVFLSGEPSSRSSLLTIREPRVRRTFHRDSVASVVMRTGEGAASPGAAAIGALLAVALFYVALGGGWPWWYGLR